MPYYEKLLNYILLYNNWYIIVCAIAITYTKQETRQDEFTPNVSSLYFATSLAFNAPDGGVLLGRSP